MNEVTRAEPESELAPSLRHLAAMTDEVGVVEHALYARPRIEEGYCTDDAGRLLAVASRFAADPDAERIARSCLGFLERAHTSGAQFRLRQRGDGRWTADPPSDDANARALLGLGTAAARAPWPEVRARARRLFDAACQLRTPFPRALAYAALGAAELVREDPTNVGALSLLTRVSEVLNRGVESRSPRWPWWEPRLTYANALLPEAALAAAVLGRDATGAERALARLDWLLRRQTRGGHFSFVGVEGADESTVPPQFDQQPIEAWATASACARAFDYTRDTRWADEVRRAAHWFLGANDVGVVLYDADTGGGYDGLEASGANLNQGAESSMAFVATMAALREVAGAHAP